MVLSSDAFLQGPWIHRGAIVAGHFPPRLGTVRRGVMSAFPGTQLVALWRYRDSAPSILCGQPVWGRWGNRGRQENLMGRFLPDGDHRYISKQAHTARVLLINADRNTFRTHNSINPPPPKKHKSAQVYKAGVPNIA